MSGDAQWRRIAVVNTPWGMAIAVPIIGDAPDEIVPGIVLTLGEGAKTGVPEIDARLGGFPEPPAQPEQRRQRRVDVRQAIVRTLAGAEYFTAVYLARERDLIGKYLAEGVTPPGGAAFEHFDPALVFNAEAAVGQMRAALDAAASAFHEVGIGGTTYGQLVTNVRKSTDSRAGQFAHTLNAAEPAMNLLKQMRDKISHPSKRRPGESSFFGSFTHLPHVPGHREAYIALPRYEDDRLVRDLLPDLVAQVSAHASDLVDLLWSGKKDASS